MKRIITIFFLILSVAYMLPISAMVKKESTHFIIDIDDESEDKNKKEKKLEIISVPAISYSADFSPICNYKITFYMLSSLFQIVETPPPDFI